MKILLTKDTPKIGRKDEIKEFPDGYARNFILPKGIGIPATPAVLADLEKRKTLIRVEKEVQNELLLKNLESLRRVTVVMKRKANDKGHLFSSIHETDISDELSKVHRVSVDPGAIKLDEPIKELGEKKIKVSMGGKSSEFTLLVEKA